MKKIGEFVCKHKWMIVIISFLLLIPSMIGMYKTRINYDILVYLPEDIETLKGEHILTEDFHMGSFAVAIVDNVEDKNLLALENKIKNVAGVDKVFSIQDIAGTTIPLEFLPQDIVSKVMNENSKLVFITFTGSTSDDETLDAVAEIRELTEGVAKVGGMSAMVLDTKELFNSEMALYVFIAVILCIVVLLFSLDSYLVPFLLLANIGVAILFNMGTNILLGDISYITKAISSVLQLGVTTDFSIFLYHKYEKAKKEYNNKDEAMSHAIHDTLVSVFGSSLTTIAGFLALCTMKLTLGVDIGLVMAKGVLLGVICVVTLFPALLLVCDKWVEKTTHKEWLPKFSKVKDFVLKRYKVIFCIFLILFMPFYVSQKKTEVYYNLAESIPDNYGYQMAAKALKEDFNIVSQEILLVDSSMDNATMNALVSEIKSLDGIEMVFSSSLLSEYGISEEILPEALRSMCESEDYKMILVSSLYGNATNELNSQITDIQRIVAKYDDQAIVAGEGPLMKDLVEITDEDFKNVNVTSIAVIFVLMAIVLKSISLPILLVTAIEFAIFINMGIPYFTGTKIPFIASVVIGTIQLGATIDYAILLTTKYLEERKQGIPKEKAISSALESSIGSIFVSAMCFFAATIGVGLVSKIDMIGSLCTLIARGAIISMFVVVLVVPSLLLLFDSLVCKTTLGFQNKKGEKKMKKINMKKTLQKMTVWSCIGLMSFSCLPVYALSKEETVYSKLNVDGSTNYTMVTEHLHNDSNKDVIKDESDLQKIINTNGNEEYSLEKYNLTWKANGKDIYYKGTTEKELPVQLKVTYSLNEKEMSVQDMLGKSGKVKMTLQYVNKDKHVVMVNGKKTTLYTPFVVAVGTMFDTDKVSNIKVNNGKVVSNGKSYVVAGIAAPGLYESLHVSSMKGMDTITICFDTTDFELNSIYSTVTAKLLEESDLSVFDSLDTLGSTANLLGENSAKLVDGTKEVSDGAKKLRNAVMEAIKEIQNNQDSIDADSLDFIKKQAVLSAVAKVKEDEPEIKKAAIESLIKSEAKTHQIRLASDAGVDSNVSLVMALKLAAHEEMKQTNEGKAAYEACMAGNATYCAIVKQVEDQAIQIAKDEIYENAMNLAKATTASTAYETALQTAEEVASNVSVSVATMVANQVKSVVMNQVVVSLNSLVGGLDSLVTGAETVSSGMKQFDEDGIQMLTGFVTNTIKPTNAKVKSLLKLANEYDTFTMKDKSIQGNTKFVLVVDGVKKDVKTEVPVVEKENDTFWQRLIHLFK